MREILFRGKRLDNGNWVYGNLFVSDTDGRTYILVGSRIVTIEWEVDPDTVGQYIDLKDKNGKRIFEGDILDTSGWIVTYCADTSEGLGMHAGWYIQRDNFESWMEIENTSDHLVLGNIHDNPELLEGGNQ